MNAAAGPSARASDAWADACLAALLLAVHPQGLGGVRLRGAPDERRDEWLCWLRSALPASAPWQRLPLHVDDERLLGGMDLGATLQRGTVVLQPGLLARSDGGVLLAAMAERMSPGLAARLAAVLDHGCVEVQWGGRQQVAPARVAVVALDESPRDEAPVAGSGAEPQGPPAAMLERLGLCIDLENLPRPDASVAQARSEPAAMAQAVMEARSRLPGVHCPGPLLQALCESALALGAWSMRLSLFALAAARAHAAWCGRDEVTVEDAQVAARLVLAPRATRVPAAAPDAQDTPPAPDEAEEAHAQTPEPPATTEQAPSEAAATTAPPPPRPQQMPEQGPTPADPSTQPDASTPDRVLQAALAAVPPGLLAMLASAAGRAPAGAGGRAGALQASRKRGRPYGSRRGDPRSGARLHLIDTLRAAAPWQKLRRQEQALLRERAAGVLGPAGDRTATVKTSKANWSAAPAAQALPAPAVLVRREDFHICRLRQRRETTTLFVVDASGSAALHRLAEAKGAVELLLADCYVRRDRVALLAFRGHAGAELLLPPTRSLVRTKRCLSGMAGGGGTPLASALDAARDLAQGITQKGGTALTVFLTDGRANIARDGSPGRERAQADALVSARLWQGSGLGALWLDTAPQPQAAAQHIAMLMGARYLPLPHADAQQMTRAVTALR